MTVSIPIIADVGGVQRAMHDIEVAIQRTNQVGKDFARLDFSHPELAETAADLQRVQQNLRDLLSVSRGPTAAASRRLIDGSSANLFGPDGLLERMGRASADPRQASALQQNASNFLFRGTSYVQPQGTPGAPPIPAPPPPPPTARERAPLSGGDDEGGGFNVGGLFQGLLSGAGPIGFVTRLAGLEKIGSMVGSSLHGAQEESVSNDRLYRSMDGLAGDFGELRDSIRKTTEGLGLTYQQAQQLAGAMVRISGAMPENLLQQNVRFAAGFARGYGLDPSDVAQSLSRISNTDNRGIIQGLGAEIAEAVRAGNMGGQADEVMHSLLRWSESASRMMVGDMHGEAFLGMYASMNASKVGGLTEGAAEALISRINSAVMHGGAAGPAGDAVTYRAFGRAGVTDPYEIQYRLSKGMFESADGHGGASNYEIMRQEINRLYGPSMVNGKPNYRRLMAMSQYFGVSMSQAEGVDMVAPVDMRAGQKAMKRLGIDWSRLDGSAIPDAFRIATEDDGRLAGERTRILGAGGFLHGKLTSDEEKELGGLGGDALRKRLIELDGRYGAPATAGSAMLDATASLTNAMTRLGDKLEPIVTKLTEGLSTVVGSVDSLADILKALIGGNTGTAPGDPHGAGDLTGLISYKVGGPAGRAIAGRGGAPIGIRTNNPLNLGAAPGQDYQVAADGEHVGVFSSMTDGIAAAARQLLRYQDVYHLSTIRQLARKWVGHTPTAGYIAGLERSLGMSADAPIDLHDPRMMQGYIEGAAPWESGRLGKGDVQAGVAAGMGHQFHVAPLEVIHKDQTGKVIKREHLPITRVPPARPWGAQADA